MNSLKNIAAGLSDPRTLWLKTMHRRLVSFTLCSHLARFARSRSGREVTHVIDVGANLGQFAFMVRYCWPEAVIDSFEPDSGAASEFRRIHGRDARVRLHESALGETSGRLTMRRGATSGQNSPLLEIGKPTTASFETIVHAIDDTGLETPTGARLLKLDVQGYEMHVLRGARATLASSQYVLIEVSLADVFEGGARIEDVWTFLRSKGFVYDRVLDQYHDPSSREITQMDVLFRKVR